MGGDGGSIPKRDDLVKQRKEHKVDKQAEEAVKWRNCALSQEPLCKPVVACGFGRLYNKTSVIEFLLDRTKYSTVAANTSHIQSLRDVVELKLNSNVASTSSESILHNCPVSGTAMNGKFAFVCLCNCGCTIAERALRELHRSETATADSDTARVRACPVCSKAYREHEVIVLNPTTTEQVTVNELNLTKRRDEKAAAKRRNNGSQLSSNASTSADAQPTQTNHPSPRSSSKQSLSNEGSKSNVTSKGETAERKKPEEEKKVQGAKRPAESSSTTKASKVARSSSSTSTATSLSAAILPQSLVRGSIQKDPTASATYKSLFTTCEEAKKQAKPNWVTYNPLYFR